MHKSGFTLIELMIVVVIIAILAAFALPNYIRAVEKSRAAEGAHILGEIRASQFRWREDFGKGTNFTSSFSDLDIELDPKYFDIENNLTRGGYVGIVRRKADKAVFGRYELAITEGGDIDCSGGVPNGCAILGYP